MSYDVFDRRIDDPVQVLDPDGHVVSSELLPELEDETLAAMYRDMRFCRQFDERMISLQRQGRIGTYSSLAGQEGSQIGSTYALHDEDTLFYQYREHGALIARELPWEYLIYWMGNEDGNAALADVNVFPLNITIGDHLPHAVGWAWASKLNGDDRTTVVHFGDGATSEGDFHEGLNFAGVFDTPTIFICNNNQWAISVPRHRQTASNTLSQKAKAYGFDGIQVDGMDPLATYVVTKAAREKAAAGNGSRPTLIEAIQYRFGAHTTADDPSAYRDEEEVKRWRERDPIDRLEAFLCDQGIIDNEWLEQIEVEIEETIAAHVDQAEEHGADPDNIFTDVFAELPDRLKEQREYLHHLREQYGDDALLTD